MKKIVHLLTLSCVLLFIRCSSQSKQAELFHSASILLAKDYHNKDSLNKALSLVNRVIGIDKSNYHYYLLRFKIEYGLDKYDSAISDIDVVLKLDPEFIDIKLPKGFILEKMSKKEEALRVYKDALNDYDKYLSRDSTNLNKLINRAFAIMLIEGKDSGINEYEKIHHKFNSDKNIAAIGNTFYSFNRDGFIRSYLE